MIGLRELQKCKNGVLGPITGLGCTNGDVNFGLCIRALSDDEDDSVKDEGVVILFMNVKGTGLGFDTEQDVVVITVGLDT